MTEDIVQEEEIPTEDMDIFDETVDILEELEEEYEDD